jgi:hypothetical protein
MKPGSRIDLLEQVDPVVHRAAMEVKLQLIIHDKDYQVPATTATSVPALTGRHLAHTHANRVVRAFNAADLHSGAKRLVQPTMVQAAFIARVSTAYAWWAEKRMAERAAIEAGYVPLVPAGTPARGSGNGHTALAPVDIDDDELVRIAELVGVSRMIDAAAMAERNGH